MFMNRDEEIMNAIMAWMALAWILCGACAIGLTLSILKVILNYFGITNSL